jgi:hypothetical protein
MPPLTDDQRHAHDMCIRHATRCCLQSFPRLEQADARLTASRILLADTQPSVHRATEATPLDEEPPHA